MLKELNTAVTDGTVLRQGFIVRNGFVFVLGSKPAVYDTLLIRSPSDAVGPSNTLIQAEHWKSISGSSTNTSWKKQKLFAGIFPLSFSVPL